MIFCFSFRDVWEQAFTGFYRRMHKFRQHAGACRCFGGMYRIARGHAPFRISAPCLPRGVPIIAIFGGVVFWERFPFAVIRHILSFQSLPCVPLSREVGLRFPVLHYCMCIMGRHVLTVSWGARPSVLPPSVSWPRLVVSHPSGVGFC